MKINWLITSILCLFTIWGIGQDLVESRYQVIFTADIDYLQNAMDNSNLEIFPTNSIVANPTMTMDKHEILINFDLPATTGYYDTDLKISLDEKTLAVYEDCFLGHFGKHISHQSSNEIIWTGILEDFVNLKGKLKVELIVINWTKRTLPLGINCDNPPTFTNSQKRPYYIAGVSGAALLATSQIFRSRSNKLYEEEYLLSNNREEATSLYDQANRQNKIAIVMGYAGTAILAGDLILYLVRNAKHKKRITLFNENCENKISLSPYVESRTKTLRQTTAGITLRMPIN